jgi:16S rRNA (adenine1518-N6/adenine1519-N6)-dimethyltransferase
MLQDEVVERMIAGPGGRHYGRLSVMLQYRFRIEKLFTVPPRAFTPPPKVGSAAVRLIPHPQARLQARDDQLLGRVVAAAFAQRRKMLRSALRPFLAAEDFAALAIDPTLRPEDLTVAQFVAISNHVEQRAAAPAAAANTPGSAGRFRMGSFSSE